VVLLADGRSPPDELELAVRQAQRLRVAGVRLHVVALEPSDPGPFVAVAGSESVFHGVGSAEELVDLYRELAEALAE
jgi:hypothetical protein